MHCVILLIYLKLRSDPSMICVAIGYGFFLEMTLDEALNFIEKKVKILQEQADCLTKDAAKIKGHVRLVLEVST